MRRARPFRKLSSRTLLKGGCANRQKLLREPNFVDIEKHQKINETKLGQHCEMSRWNWLTCLACPHLAASLDWGHAT